MSDHQERMLLGIEKAKEGLRAGKGGPFGAVIVQKDTGEILSIAHNRVLETNDPTMHAEVVAIREVCAKRQSFFLEDCVIYATCHPCPMCLGAIHWARIGKCYFSGVPTDAEAVGFSDKFIYDFIRGSTEDVRCELVHLPHPQSKEPFDLYEKQLEVGTVKRY
eukprot:TRINITY_DN4964_c0_g1_i1.p1 TRINITY_DN4964_c0_g1~~TRINITY_DN4964_c0_g1_i1.p1  ORF type:complete len:163 (-),score=28.19 TRINITY_DN4964_c0_g1_i1:214-702(-)